MPESSKYILLKNGKTILTFTKKVLKFCGTLNTKIKMLCYLNALKNRTNLWQMWIGIEKRLNTGDR